MENRKYTFNGAFLELPRHARLVRQDSDILLAVDYHADTPSNRLSHMTVVCKKTDTLDQDTVDTVLFETLLELRKNKRKVWKRPKQGNPHFPEIEVPAGISIRLRPASNHGELCVFYFPDGIESPRDQYIFSFTIDSKREYVKAMIAAKACIADLRTKGIPFIGRTMYEVVDLNAPVTRRKTTRMHLGSIELPPGIYVDKNSSSSGLTYLKMVYKDFVSTRTTHTESRRIYETSPKQIQQAIQELVAFQKQKHSEGYVVKGLPYPV